ncbi:DUF6879 family protein [Actinoplanes derwentensis]|uniref:DUF6879 domain-containing protein n=1 Tax=Actinoplanes derwentensis TaxID=113562 RepID=A0A1H1SLG2_9ACTN|nr:DUF6879 family protein [Actinoplanes derwentensis]GID83271.1 hypothetical protein Ade03nite_21950 [Actinoplanes derwentensis]SDS48782.1 hypothetical protein SAMN04489716_0892 [Actinoplanes derwentensis]
MSVDVHQVGQGSGIIRSAVVTVATGGTTFLITNGLDQPMSTCVMLSVLIGGIVLMVRFLVKFEKRLAAVEKLEKEGMAEMKKLVSDAFTEISEATALFGLIEASALQTDVVTQLVRNSTHISPDSPPIIYRFVQSKIKETSDLLKQLAESGTVTYYGEDRDWLLGLTRHATETIDAISIAAVDHGLWDREIGQRYLDVQRRSARDGRRVRRIFVLDRPEMQDDPTVRRAYEEQRQMAIDVRLLHRSAVPTPLQVQIRDLILFDDTLAYETTPTITETLLAQVAETRLVLNEARVKEYTQLFRELWEVSREIDGQTNT